MNKKILVAVLLAASFSAAAWGSCFWQKIAEVKGDRGVICTWRCGYGSDALHTTTSGIAYCPRPR